MHETVSEKNESILVSVIMLTYNHERYIQQALDGVLMQNADFSFEILVGDDASSDKTPEILREYQKRYPNVIKATLRKENVGPTRNAYELFLLAQGKYLATCEGDDYWIDPDKLKKQIRFLEDHPEYIGCSHPSMVVDEHGVALKRQRLRWEWRKQETTLRDFKGYYLPGQASSLVRRNLYGKYSNMDLSFFYKVHWAIGDRTTALIYLSQGKFYRFKEVMGCYRVTQTARSVTAKIYRDNEKWLQEDLAYTKQLLTVAAELDAHVDFEFYLAHLLISALLQWSRHPGKDAWNLILHVLNTSSRKKRIIFYVPVAFWKKITNYLFAI